MVDGWMGRVSMCSETLLDECYLRLLAQVPFMIAFFSLILWSWFLMDDSVSRHFLNKLPLLSRDDTIFKTMNPWRYPWTYGLLSALLKQHFIIQTLGIFSKSTGFCMEFGRYPCNGHQETSIHQSSRKPTNLDLAGRKNLDKVPWRLETTWRGKKIPKEFVFWPHALVISNDYVYGHLWYKLSYIYKLYIGGVSNFETQISSKNIPL